MQLYYHGELPDQLLEWDGINLCQGEYYLAINELNELVGVIGAHKKCFLQSAITKRYRGQGNLKKMLDRYIEIERPEKLLATILKTNIASRKAFEKLGYKQTLEGLIPEDSIRLTII